MVARIVRLRWIAEADNSVCDENPLRFVALPYRSCSAPAREPFSKARGLLIAVIALALLAWVVEAQAAGDLSRQAPIELQEGLGKDQGVRRFFTERIELEYGELYRFILSNPSLEKHYFSSDAFAQAVCTRKV